MRRPHVFIAAAPHDPPDDDAKGDRGGDDGESKEQQRRIENRFRLHPHFDVEWLAFQPRLQWLLPPQDVPPLRLTGRRVVIRNLARDVHLEDDHLAARPPGDRCVFRSRSHSLSIHEVVALAVEPVRGPREHPLSLQLSNVGNVEADVDEPPAVAPRQREARRGRSGNLKQRAHSFAIETRLRVHREIDAAQCNERGNRRIDVDRGRAVQPQVDLFFVLVLLRQRTARRANQTARHRGQNQRGLPHPHTHQRQ